MLPPRIEQQNIKENEAAGWEKVFIERGWQINHDNVHNLLDSGDTPYWRIIQRCMPFVDAALGDIRNKHGIDIASGFGWAATRFAKQNARMTAADFNITEFNGLGAARHALDEQTQFDLLQCDAEELPIQNESLDFAFICSALHHFTEPARAVQEVYRTLKPGGMFILICEAIRTGFCDAYRDKKNPDIHEFRNAGINEQSFKQSEYERMFLQAGFHLHTFFPAWDFPNGQPFGAGWIHSDLRNALQDRSKIKQWIIRLLWRTPLLKLSRHIRMYYKATDRIFIAIKPN
ncbi:class I SAM-dependent methyltransferase [Candidatus Sumerlaeota bacterium]|nr:class I SAM-dependent methyltransferase [Candidatus Sumerlaeota bacterium]